MLPSTSQEYLSARRAEARKIVADPTLCAAKPHLRRMAWETLTGRSSARFLHLIPAMRTDRDPGDAA